MFNVCLSWSYCSGKSLAKLKCENDVYVYINEGLIIIIILMVLQLHLWLFYFPHHSLIVLGESRLTAILPFLRFPRKEESCSGEIIVLKVLYLYFFILWQSIYHSWHAIHWGGMEEYNSEWLRGMHFCCSQYQTS